MDVAMFKSIIAKNGGEDKVVSITFDGGSTRTFVREEPYSHAVHLDEDNAVLNFVELDMRGHAYIVTRPIEVVHGLCFATGPYNRTSYDPSTLRGL